MQICDTYVPPHTVVPCPIRRLSAQGIRGIQGSSHIRLNLSRRVHHGGVLVITESESVCA